MEVLGGLEGLKLRTASTRLEARGLGRLESRGLGGKPHDPDSMFQVPSAIFTFMTFLFFPFSLFLLFLCHLLTPSLLSAFAGCMVLIKKILDGRFEFRTTTLIIQHPAYEALHKRLPTIGRSEIDN